MARYVLGPYKQMGYCKVVSLNDMNEADYLFTDVGGSEIIHYYRVNGEYFAVYDKEIEE